MFSFPIFCEMKNKLISNSHCKGLWEPFAPHSNLIKCDAKHIGPISFNINNNNQSIRISRKLIAFNQFNTTDYPSFAFFFHSFSLAHTHSMARFSFFMLVELFIQLNSIIRIQSILISRHDLKWNFSIGT